MPCQRGNARKALPNTTILRNNIHTNPTRPVTVWLAGPRTMARSQIWDSNVQTVILYAVYPHSEVEVIFVNSSNDDDHHVSYFGS